MTAPMTSREALAQEIEINRRIDADHRFSDDEAQIILEALRGVAQSSAQMSERINVIVRDYGLEKSSASETHDALIAVLGVAQAAPKLTLTDITIHNNGVAQSMAAQAAREPRLAERLTDVIMMLDTPDAYNREYIAAVCRSILSSSTDRGGK